MENKNDNLKDEQKGDDTAMLMCQLLSALEK